MLAVLLVEPALIGIVGVGVVGAGVVGAGVVGADFLRLAGEGYVPTGLDDNGGMSPN